MMITCMNSPIVVDVPGLKDCIRKERSTTISVWESGAFFWIWTYSRIQCIRSALVPWNISPVGVVKDGGWLLLSLENSNSLIFLPAFKAWRIKILWFISSFAVASLDSYGSLLSVCLDDMINIFLWMVAMNGSWSSIVANMRVVTESRTSLHSILSTDLIPSITVSGYILSCPRFTTPTPTREYYTLTRERHVYTRGAATTTLCSI